jgi:hypothetical protein
LVSKTAPSQAPNSRVGPASGRKSKTRAQRTRKRNAKKQNNAPKQSAQGRRTGGAATAASKTPAATQARSGTPPVAPPGPAAGSPSPGPVPTDSRRKYIFHVSAEYLTKLEAHIPNTLPPSLYEIKVVGGEQSKASHYFADCVRKIGFFMAVHHYLSANVNANALVLRVPFLRPRHVVIVKMLIRPLFPKVALHLIAYYPGLDGELLQDSRYDHTLQPLFNHINKEVFNVRVSLQLYNPDYSDYVADSCLFICDDYSLPTSLYAKLSTTTTFYICGFTVKGTFGSSDWYAWYKHADENDVFKGTWQLFEDGTVYSHDFLTPLTGYRQDRTQDLLYRVDEWTVYRLGKQRAQIKITDPYLLRFGVFPGSLKPDGEHRIYVDAHASINHLGVLSQYALSNINTIACKTLDENEQWVRASQLMRYQGDFALAEKYKQDMLATAVANALHHNVTHTKAATAEFQTPAGAAALKEARALQTDFAAEESWINQFKQDLGKLRPVTRVVLACLLVYFFFVTFGKKLLSFATPEPSMGSILTGPFLITLFISPLIEEWLARQIDFVTRFPLIAKMIMWLRVPKSFDYNYWVMKTLICAFEVYRDTNGLSSFVFEVVHHFAIAYSCQRRPLLEATILHGALNFGGYFKMWYLVTATVVTLFFVLIEDSATAWEVFNYWLSPWAVWMYRRAFSFYLPCKPSDVVLTWTTFKMMVLLLVAGDKGKGLMTASCLSDYMCGLNHTANCTGFTVVPPYPQAFPPKSEGPIPEAFSQSTVDASFFTLDTLYLAIFACLAILVYEFSKKEKVDPLDVIKGKTPYIAAGIYSVPHAIPRDVCQADTSYLEKDNALSQLSYLGCHNLVELKELLTLARLLEAEHIIRKAPWYPFNHVCIRSFVPAHSDINLIHAMLHRHIKARPSLRGVFTPAWAKVRTAIVPVLAQAMIREGWTFADRLHPMSAIEYANHFRENKKRKDYVDYVRRTFRMRTPKTYTKVFVKSDEMLLKRENNKPRTIANVDKHYQLTIGPYTYAVSKALATRFDVYREPLILTDPETGRKTKVLFMYGSGRNEDSLSAFGQMCMEGAVQVDYFLIVCGDDVLVYDVFYDTAIELDASMMDQSNGYPALQSEFLFYEMLGMPSEIIADLNTISKLPYRYDFKCGQTIYLKRPDFVDISGAKNGGRFRCTGAPNTTTGNSLVMTLSTLYLLMKRRLTVTDYAQFGLEMKYRELPFVGGATFLKGWWLPTQEGLRWMVLPSRRLKMGKRLTNPFVNYGHLIHRKVRNFTKYDRQEAYKLAAFEIAMCYRTMKNLPVMRGFIQKALGFKQFEGLGEEIVRPEYSVQMGTITPTFSYKQLQFVYEAFREKYGLSRNEIFDMEDFDRRALDRMPALVSHPGFQRLSRDYA